jgi:hypothetical protein
MISYDFAKEIILGSGLSHEEADLVLQQNNRSFLSKILERL